MSGSGRDISHILADFNNPAPAAQGVAQTQAKATLRDKNRLEWQCDLTIIGNPGMNAGMTFDIEDFGVFSGRYIALSVTHSVSDAGYVTEIKAHRVLGY